MRQGTTRRKFSKEFKIESVALSRPPGPTVAKAASGQVGGPQAGRSITRAFGFRESRASRRRGFPYAWGRDGNLVPACPSMMIRFGRRPLNTVAKSSVLR